MIDTVLFQAFPVRRLPALDESREIADPATGLYTQNGYFRNMYVRLRSDGELVVQGSLPRYLFGNNNENLRRREIEEGVHELASAFDVQPEVCRVYRLDLAATMPMPRPVALYLDALGPVPRMQQRRFGNETVDYVSQTRKLHFYDKGKEAGLPGNLLRIEVQYKKRLKRQLKRNITFTDLYESGFFTALVDRWGRAYDSVRKRRRYLLKPTKSVRHLLCQLAGIGLEHLGGLAVVLCQVDAWEGDRQQKYRLRSALIDLAVKGNSRADADLIRELDAAVEEAGRLALSP